MDINIWSPSVLIAILGITLIIGGRFSKKTPNRKMFLTIGIIAVSSGLVVLLLGANLPSQLSFLNAPLWAGLGKTATIGGTTITYSAVGQNNQGQVSVSTFQPTATYTDIDKFSTTSVSGTSYYKVNNNKATTTAYTNVNAGDSITYWVDNSTYYTLPEVVNAISGPNVVQADAYSNGSITVSGYDIVQDRAISSGAYNSSMAANANSKEKLTVVGSAKTSNMPFGGVMIVEFNSTIPTASCSGDGIVGLNTKYQVTHTPTLVGNRYLVYEVASGFDTSKDGGNTGVTNVIRCDFTNGATASGAGSAWYVKFIPANYYISNDGRILLDTEKSANSATTRTGLGGSSTTFYFGA